MPLGDWSRSATTAGLVQQIGLFDVSSFVSIVVWQHFVTLHDSGVCILDHPAYPEALLLLESRGNGDLVNLAPWSSPHMQTDACSSQHRWQVARALLNFELDHTWNLV
jgi:hypothetical protein